MPFLFYTSKRAVMSSAKNQSLQPSLSFKTWATGMATLAPSFHWLQCLSRDSEIRSYGSQLSSAKQLRGAYLRFIQAVGELSMSWSGHFIRDLTLFIPEQTKDIAGNFCNKNNVSTEPESSKLLWIVNQWSPLTSWALQKSVSTSCVTGWKPQLGSSPQTWG